MLSTKTLEWVRGASLKRDSGNVRTQYLTAYKKFEAFCQSEFNHSVDEEIGLIREAEERREGRVYETLHKFVIYLSQKSLRGTTIDGYMAGVKAYLVDHDVEINDAKFRRRVRNRMPEKYPIPEILLDKTTIRKIIEEGRGIDKRLKALILLLTSSGMRLQEALRLRIRDISFEEKPVKISLAGQTTKTGRPREAYMTTEAAQNLKALRREKDQYVFDWMDIEIPETKDQAKVKGPEGYRIYMAEKKATQMLRRRIKSLGMDAKVTDDHRVHQIHFHLFRKFFSQEVIGIAGESTAHFLLGHKPYMGMYNLGEEDRVRQIYADKLGKALSIFEPTASIETVEDLEAEINVLSSVHADLIKRITALESRETVSLKENDACLICGQKVGDHSVKNAIKHGLLQRMDEVIKNIRKPLEEDYLKALKEAQEIDRRK